MSEKEKLLQLNQRLLDAIAAADWTVYEELCDPALTAFEPEAAGHLVAGMDFHRFYFDLGTMPGKSNTTMSSPYVRIFGDVALVCCVRLIQRETPEGPVTVAFNETRVWHKRDGEWKHVHFHRSSC